MKIKMSEKKHVIKFKMTEKEWEQFTQSMLSNAKTMLSNETNVAAEPQTAKEPEAAAEGTTESNTPPDQRNGGLEGNEHSTGQNEPR